MADVLFLITGSHPRSTPSGRIELYSYEIAGFGYDDCSQYPSWIEPTEWLGSRREAPFPLYLLSPQPANRLHSQLDSVGDSQADKIDGCEIATFAVEDARSRGLCEGDIARLFNERGACLVGVSVSDTLMPGVVILPTGAWFTPGTDSAGRNLERAGNPRGSAPFPRTVANGLRNTPGLMFSTPTPGANVSPYGAYRLSDTPAGLKSRGLSSSQTGDNYREVSCAWRAISNHSWPSRPIMAMVSL
ncbi:hypothetical protein J7355_16215 [Endozoicomonas sp. G2_2]|nr:hypothetical protein [Endozoicomonas sp. G2_2]